MGSSREWNDFETLRARVDDEQEDVLGAALLVGDEPELRDRLWGRLVDLLVEGLFLDLRAEFLEGRIGPEIYVSELKELAARCRAVGLAPLPASGH